MSVEFTPDELREFLLNKQELEEELNQHYAPCYQVSWDKKRQSLIVRVDNKKIIDITQEDIPEPFIVNSMEFIQHILAILRESGVDGLMIHLEELKCLRK